MALGSQPWVGAAKENFALGNAASGMAKNALGQLPCCKVHTGAIHEAVALLCKETLQSVPVRLSVDPASAFT
eukprot:3398847-Alexandrium_andersonii.AAC.1